MTPKLEHTPGPYKVDPDPRPDMEQNFHIVTGTGRALCFCSCGWPDDGSAEDQAELLALADTAPHECSVADCPGDLNRRKLELFGELVKTLSVLTSALSQHRFNSFHPLPSHGDVSIASNLVTRAEQLTR